MVGSMVRMIILVMRKVRKEQSVRNEMKVMKIGSNGLVEGFMFLVMSLMKVI